MPEPFISIDGITGSIYRPTTAPAYTNITEFNEEPVGIKTTLVLALPFDENTSFTDIAPAMRVDRTVANKTVTTFNGVGISSVTGVQLGRSSAYFDGVSDYVDLGSSADFSFGTGDFTVECWIYTTNTTADTFYRRIYMTDGPTGNAGGNFQIALEPSTGKVNLWDSVLNLLGTSNVCNGIWHHIAGCRSGTTLRLFVDGVLESSTTYSTSVSPNSGSPRPRIGSYSGTSGDFDGYIQDLRVYKGYAKYTSNFTPPTRITGGFGAVVSSTTTEGARLQAVFRETGISTNKLSVPTRITKYVDVNQIGTNPIGFPYTISPALPSGATAGDFATGLSIVGVGTTGKGYTLTPSKNMSIIVRMWGAGGGRYFDGTNYTANSGAGGAAYGRVTLTGGTSYLVFAGGTGQDATSSRGAPGGGAASGILLASNQSEILIAGGGAGSYGVTGGGRASGAGGGTTGQDGEGATTGGDGGTQTAGGAGGAGGRRTGASATNTNGAGGATGTPSYFGGYSGITSSNGAAKYNGGTGDLNGGDAGSPGGGGGHFGGGQGGGDAGAFGSGGGSGFYNGSVVVGIGTTILYTGFGSSPGNSSDPYRGTYGNVAQPGLVYLSLV
jgi:hypothetical protein